MSNQDDDIPPERLVTMDVPVSERTRLKMKIAQGVRDLDAQGLQNVLAVVAAERTRQGLDSK
jgi:hypothetical protein